MDRYLNYLPTSLTRDAALAPIITAATPSISKAAKLFKWNLSPTALVYVSSMGITANPFAVLEHTHPVHKTHEVHLLYADWVFKATKESTMLYMKESKFKELQTAQPNFKYLINQINTPKDLTRYALHNSGPVITPLAFLHDALMYIKPAQIADLFERSPRLQTLYASIVHPAEVELGVTSFYPSLYQFKKFGDSISYMLENKSDGAYTQPADCNEWLKINKIVYGDMTLSVTLIKTSYSFHQLLITRVVINNLDTFRIFDTPKSVLLPDTFGIKNPVSARLVPKDVCDMLFQYVRAVRTLRVTDPFGVIRTQRTKPEYAWVSNQAWDLLTKYASDTATYRPLAAFEYNQTVVNRIKNWFSNHRIVLTTVFGGTASLYLAYKAYKVRNLVLCVRFLSFQVLGSSPPDWFSIAFVDTPANFMKRLITQSLGPEQWSWLSPPLREFIREKGLYIPFLTFFFGSVSAFCFTSFYWLSRKSPQATNDAYLDFISNEQFRLKINCIGKRICQTEPFFTHLKAEEEISSQNSNLNHEPEISILSEGLSNHDKIEEVIKAFASQETQTDDEPIPPPPEFDDSTIPCFVNTTNQDFDMARKNTVEPLLNMAKMINALKIPDEPDFTFDILRKGHINKYTQHFWNVFLQFNMMATQMMAPIDTNVQEILDSQSKRTEEEQAIISEKFREAFDAFSNASNSEKIIIEDLPDDDEEPPKTMDSQPNRPSTPPTDHLDPQDFQPLTPPNNSPVKETVQKKVRFNLPKVSELNLESETQSTVDQIGAMETRRPIREWFPHLKWGEFDGFFQVPRISTPYYSPILKPDCLLVAFSQLTGISRESLWSVLCSAFPESDLAGPVVSKYGLDEEHLAFLAAYFSYFVNVTTDVSSCAYGDPSSKPIYMGHTGTDKSGHWFVSSKSSFQSKLFGGRISHQEDSRIYPLLKKAQAIKRPIACTKIHTFIPDRERAKALLNNMKQGCDGIMSRKLGKENVPLDLFDAWKQKVMFTPDRSFELILVQGFAGCGKTSPVTKVLKTEPNYRVCLPTTHLRDEWKENLKPDKMNVWRVSTWEMSLLRHSALAVIDEVYKIPPGYLDLLCYLDPTLTSLIVLGDPCQGEYHSVNSDSTLDRLVPEKIRLRPFSDIYCAWTYRLDQTTAKALGVRTFNTAEGHPIRHFANVRSTQPILTASKNIATSLADNSLRAQTMASSQGLTFNQNVGIYLDKHILSVSRESALVAVTRSRRGYFTTGDQCIMANLHATPFLYVFGLRIGSILHDFRDVLSHLKIIYDPSQIPSLALRGGGSLTSKTSKKKSLISVPSINQMKAKALSTYEGDVLIDNRKPLFSFGMPRVSTIDSTFVPETKRVHLASYESADPEEISFSSSDFTPPVHEPVYPGCDYHALKDELLRDEDPASLEKVGPSGLSNQFPFIDKPFRDEVDYPGLIAPQHNIKADPDLLIMSVEKRLRFRRTEFSSITAEHQIAGTLLFKSYCQAWNISSEPIPFDEVLFLECILDNDYVQLTSKTKAAIIANQSRSDPTWRHTVVRIFSKTQHKINLNTLYTEWKACQTLALMHDIIVLLLGPVKKYQRKMLEREKCLNPNIFVLGGKSPRDLSKFAQEHFPRGVERVANDYTSFDQSQGGEAVYFEVLKMRRVSIPEHLIQLHEQLKTELTCQFGPLTPMRFTGEPGTYDDNTDFNLAIINLEYYLADTPLCISGDDSLLAYQPFKRDSWISNSKWFPDLQWKKQQGLYGEFCGYYVSHAGAVRAPKPMLAKLALSDARNELELTIPSYLAEFCVGHSLGDSLWECLPLDDVLWQSAVFDFFCRKTPRALKVALKQGEVPDDLLLRMGKPLTHQAYCTLSFANRKKYLQMHSANPHNWVG